MSRSHHEVARHFGPLRVRFFLDSGDQHRGQPAWAADPVVGTWRMGSWTEEDTESKTVRKVFGEHPNGLLTLTADGRMMAIVTDPNRKAPAQPKPTDAEALQLSQTMNAYAGTIRSRATN